MSPDRSRSLAGRTKELCRLEGIEVTVFVHGEILRSPTVRVKWASATCVSVLHLEREGTVGDAS
jgi:hypothetical protein